MAVKLRQSHGMDCERRRVFANNWISDYVEKWQIKDWFVFVCWIVDLMLDLWESGSANKCELLKGNNSSQWPKMAFAVQGKPGQIKFL